MRFSDRFSSPKASVLDNLLTKGGKLDGTSGAHHAAIPSSFIDRLVQRILDYSYYSDAEIETFLAGTGPYLGQVKLALELLIIGEPRLAVFVTGRTLEEALRDFLLHKRFKGLRKSMKLKMDFHSMIGHLKGRGVLTEATAVKMLSLKWDRNYGGHPASEAEISQMMESSSQMFELGVILIKNVLKLGTSGIRQI